MSFFYVFDLNFNAFNTISRSIIICLHVNLFKLIRDFVKLVFKNSIYLLPLLISSYLSTKLDFAELLIEYKISDSLLVMNGLYLVIILSKIRYFHNTVFKSKTFKIDYY